MPMHTQMNQTSSPLTHDSPACVLWHHTGQLFISHGALLHAVTKCSHTSACMAAAATSRFNRVGACNQYGRWRCVRPAAAHSSQPPPCRVCHLVSHGVRDVRLAGHMVHSTSHAALGRDPGDGLHAKHGPHMTSPLSDCYNT